MIIYECPNCDYMDSEPEMAETHCLDSSLGLW
jgi:hypothetical protein